MNRAERWVVPLFIISILLLNLGYTSTISSKSIESDYPAPALTSSMPSSYSIEEFTNNTSEGCYQTQKKDYYCGPACVQMVLCYLEFNPNPSQESIAKEMNTDFYEATLDVDMPTPFRDRGFEVIDSTHDTFQEGYDEILESIYHNNSVIILMWFSSLKRYGHYIVIIGYNETGLFVHDPWPGSAANRECGPNVYISKSLFEILWEYDDYWSMLIPYQPGLILNLEVASEHTSTDIITINVTAYFGGQKLTGSDVSAYATIKSATHYIVNRDEAVILEDDGKGNYLGNYQIQPDDMASLEEEDWDIFVNMIFDAIVGSTNTTTKVTHSPIYNLINVGLFSSAIGILALSITWIRKRRRQNLS